MLLDNLTSRLNYVGGARQVDRMIEDKKRSLNKSLLYSYQSATAVLEDGREFRCLINPNKLSMELDDKVLSIPFEDICLNKEKSAQTTTSSGKEPIGVKCGSVIEWKENGTHWIVYSQYLQEIAYFRGQMRQCESEPIEIAGRKFWYYLKGPDEKSIDWQKSKHLIFNDLNYTVELYISKDQITTEFFHRLAKCKLKGRNFEVQAVDDLSIDGVLTVYLKEDYENQWAQIQSEEEQPATEIPVDPSIAHIIGEFEIYPYDIKTYSIINATGGMWVLSANRAKILEQNDSSVTIEVTTGKSSCVTLIYRVEGMDDIKQDIRILSL